MRRPRLSQRADFVGALFLLLLIGIAPARADELVFLPAPSTPDPTQRLLVDITRAGERLVAVGAAGLIILSDDSGESWRQAEVPVSASLTAVDFPSPERGWAVGHAGVILHSDDGGESWQLQYDGNAGNAALVTYAGELKAQLEAELADLEAAEIVDQDALADLEYELEEAIFLGEDAQLAVDTGPADPLLDVRFFDERRGLAVGAYGAILRTNDGGANWELAVGSLENPDRFHLYSLLLRGEMEVYIAGEAGLLFRSSDGGQSFERYWDVYEGSLFGVVEGGDGVVVYGLRGNQFRYDEASDSWEAVTTGNQTSLYGSRSMNDGSVLFLGAAGTLLRRDSAGAETMLLHPSRSTLAAAAEAPDGRIWLVGMDGLVSYAEAQAL